MKSLATWRIQKGTTIGFVEQLLGSHTISGAFLTQANLRAYNVIGLFIVIIWCLSPLGSQASLRVVSVEHSYSRSAVTLTALNAFTQYGLGDNTEIAGPIAAALFSATLLRDRNQDLWGNIRLPSIERLTRNESTGWIDLSGSTDIDYPSLVGLPVVGLPRVGNTTFTLSGSYLNIECGNFNTDGNFPTNYTGLKPGGNTDSSWTADTSTGEFTIAISQPPIDGSLMINGTRDPRRLIWDSTGTHAECQLFTTYVDVNTSCTSNVCSPSAVRRTPQPSRDRSWTVFDLDGFGSANEFVRTLTQLFPNASGFRGASPITRYFTTPYNAASYTDAAQIYSIGKETFELRLAQLLNAQLLLGIDLPSLTGNFNATSRIASPADETNAISKNGGIALPVSSTHFTEEDRVHCVRAWLGALIVTSFTSFLIAVIAAVLRLITLVPDVLGTLSLALLDNRCQTVVGNTAWTGDERAVNMKSVQVQLGDVEPDCDVGRIGLAVPNETVSVKEVQKRRYYD